LDTHGTWGYKCATLFQRRKAGVLLSKTRVKNMDKEFLRQIDQASELTTRDLKEKLDDEVLICECFCVNVRDIREACSATSEVDLGLLKMKFSMGEGCQSCMKAANDWVNKIF
jgi:NAD(P)H-nitrite reductase large subunit